MPNLCRISREFCSVCWVPLLVVWHICFYFHFHFHFLQTNSIAYATLWRVASRFIPDFIYLYMRICVSVESSHDHLWLFNVNQIWVISATNIISFPLYDICTGIINFTRRVTKDDYLLFAFSFFSKLTKS